VGRYICGHLASFLRLKYLPSSDVTFTGDIHRCPVGPEQSDADQLDDRIHSGCIQNRNQDRHLQPAESKVSVNADQRERGSLQSASDVLYNIRDLLETRLRSDAQLRLQTDKRQQMMNLWMLAAAVIDRVCLIVFSLIFVVGTVVIFVLATAVEH